MVSCLGNEHHFDGFKFFNRLGRWPMNDCNLGPLQWGFAGAEAAGSSKEGNVSNSGIKKKAASNCFQVEDLSQTMDPPHSYSPERLRICYTIHSCVLDRKSIPHCGCGLR